MGYIVIGAIGFLCGGPFGAALAIVGTFVLSFFVAVLVAFVE